MRILLLSVGLACASAACNFTPNCDLGHGSRDSAPAATKETCCSLCLAKSGCAAGVLSGGKCWFKTADDVKNGCQKSSAMACINGAVPTPAPPSSCSSAACQKIMKTYETLQDDTCAAVTKAAPTLDASKIGAFMTLYKNYTGGSDEAPVIAAAKTVLSDSKLNSFLSLPDSFTADGLDGKMVLCTILRTATPTGLAEFAVQGSTQQGLITKLLTDPILMRDMLVAGGAARSETDKGAVKGTVPQYGPAMVIYSKLLEVSEELKSSGKAAADTQWDDRSQANILRRVALGTALEHAIPISHKYHGDSVHCDEAYDWCPTARTDTNDSFVDPVARYLHYERSYKAGDLDPAFEVLTTFEAKQTTNTHATDEDIEWFRQTLAIYRPDHIAMDYSWRYAEAVRTDVAYGDPQCAKMPGVCDGHYANIPVADGVCGPRAFFGRYTRLAFGLPTWGATQPGHAAMTTWSPTTGWGVLLGASWPFCWWGERSGPDWVLEAQAREVREDFQRVLRGGWVAAASDEEPVSQNWGRSKSTNGFGTGGPWGALMLYAKKATAAKGPTPARVVGASVVPTKVQALLEKWPTPVPAPAVATHADGSITIPAAAFTSKNRSASLTVMKSAGPLSAGEQLLHGGCASSVGPPCLAPASSSFAYTFDAPAAGSYFLTANISTWHMSQDLLVSVNQAKPVAVPVFYTVGWWNQTEPVAVTLAKGTNTLEFTRTTTRPLVLKAFDLFKTKPIVPAPPGNYTPVPAPPFPPAGAYIEVAADTTCVKQGITPVPAEDCSRACLALGFKDTGARQRPNISGCFVLTSGQYKGNCNYNTNTSATCEPPCTLFGDTVQSLCMRK